MPKKFLSGLMEKFSVLNHQIEEFIYDEPSCWCCCSKSLEERKRLNPVFEAYLKQVQAIIDEQNRILESAQISIEIFIDKDKELGRLSLWNKLFDRQSQSSDVKYWLKFLLHFNASKLHPHDESEDSDVPAYD